MDRLRPIVFFGTPQFAVSTLEALSAADRAPALVVTQPSRPAGRGREPRHPPVLAWARAAGIETWQPKSVERREFLERLEALAPDVAVVVAFGQIFPRRLLELPRRGCINLHASLLPAYRGAAPIPAAIAAGETETGVTTMLMEEGLDSGPILLQRSIPIAPGETAGELAARLAVVGGELMVETLDALEAGTLEPTPQDPRLATFAGRLKKEDGNIDWSLPAGKIVNLVRAMHPWPGAWTGFRGTPLRMISAREVAESERGSAGPPGTLDGSRRSCLRVRCGEGTELEIESLQRPGRRVVSGRDFLNAEQPREQERFGGPPPAIASKNAATP